MKKLLLILSAILIVAIPFSVFAYAADTTPPQPVRGFYGVDTSKLTDQQKADLLEQYNKMMELKKETINSLVADGAMTKAQGEAAIERIDAMIKYHEENGFTGACSIGRGFGEGRGMGRGFGGGNCIFNTPTN